MSTYAEQYRDVELQSEIESASKHRLIQLLFENSLRHLHFARKAMTDNERQKKYLHLNRAKDIVTYLHACLDKKNKETQKLATLLADCYVECEKQLCFAVVNQQPKHLDQAEIILKNLKEGWDGIGEV